MFTFLKYVLAENKDSSLKGYNKLVYLINRDNYMEVVRIFKDKERALFLENKMVEHHPLALSKIWKHCFKELPNNPELRLALDKLDKESV